jgi:predicted N-acyltransferase
MAGNSAFILFVARDGSGVAGVIVANLYYQLHFRAILLNPFRLQVNGAPMLREGHPGKENVLAALLGEVSVFADQHVPVTEFRNFPCPAEEREIFASGGFSFEPHLNLLKPLTTEEEAWRSLSKCRRRQIKRALQNGAQVVPAQSASHIRDLYKILYTLYHRKIHKKLPPYRTFIEFFRRSQETGDGVILVVLANGRVTGGIVCLIEHGKCLTEWYICGLDHESKEIYPSVMATWGGIQYACQLGLPAFNFLGLGKPGVPYGVRDFKLRFGGNVENYGRFIRENNFKND